MITLKQIADTYAQTGCDSVTMKRMLRQLVFELASPDLSDTPEPEPAPPEPEPEPPAEEPGPPAEPVEPPTPGDQSPEDPPEEEPQPA